MLHCWQLLNCKIFFLFLNLLNLVKVSKKQTVISAFIAFWWDTEYRPSASQITLPIECRGEGGVIQGARHAAWAWVGRHPFDAVLGLVWGQLPAQLLCQDVWLENIHKCLHNRSQKTLEHRCFYLLIHCYICFILRKD